VGTGFQDIFLQFPSFNLFPRKPQVCKTKSIQTENVVKKSNGSEEIYERTEFFAFSIFPNHWEFTRKTMNLKKENSNFLDSKVFMIFCGFYGFLVDWISQINCWRFLFGKSGETSFIQNSRSFQICWTLSSENPFLTLV
jgi:hypothetical protein